MLMTLTELCVASDAQIRDGVYAWSGTYLQGAEPLLLLLFLRRKADGDFEARTMLTTGTGLDRTFELARPAFALAAYAIHFDHDLKLITSGVTQFWSPAQCEGRSGTLLRLADEPGLRDGMLRPVPDVEGRKLVLEVNTPS